MSVPTAFFDLDRTLIDCNSARLWISAEWQDGRISLRQAVWASWALVRYSLGSSDLEDVYEVAVSSLAGRNEGEMEAHTRRWFEARVRARVRPGALLALERHRRAGDQLVLATSSSPYAGGAAVDAWGLDDLICTRFEVVDGQFTGKISELAFGHHKADRAREWAAQNDVDLAQTAFYTDSVTDLAMLEIVGRPVAVNPDRPLARIASERGWEIADWGKSNFG